MLRKLISESYWLENSQLIYNFGFNDFLLEVLFDIFNFRVFYTFFKA